ncbi:hypothetical protein NDU88_008000 [Pleurodeles waltl]|uniref:Uncharacterized protein n=1 Tax=Pleurodeles waltl TaxID=8319 RepID=A0AAV7RRX0_PLEWA|nr:hypothetical protein NDU88_008000 [Pleurodeles waltl]
MAAKSTDGQQGAPMDLSDLTEQCGSTRSPWPGLVSLGARTGPIGVSLTPFIPTACSGPGYGAIEEWGHWRSESGAETVA